MYDARRMPPEVSPSKSRWLREPLVHFVVLGVLLAGARSALHPEERPPPIVITDALDRALMDEHRLARGALPTDDEIAAAREHWVREEALYREALALGLDEGDAIVRRRLIQKMTFVLEAALALPVIDDAEAAAYLREHASELEIPERRALEHRYFGAGARPTPTDAADTARAQLIAGGEVPGEAFLAADGWSSVSEAELDRALGEASARAIFELEPDVWSEALPVGRGALLVRVTRIEPAHAPSLGAVRSRIDAALRDERRAAALEAAVAEVLGRYEVSRESR